MQQMASEWSASQSARLYGLPAWGGGYFDINKEGEIVVIPNQVPEENLRLLKVIERAQEEKLNFPMLIRFQDVLRHRVESVNKAFNQAIEKENYGGTYRGVFPIKVNQLREVVEEIQTAGLPYHFGLEVGSKPELCAVLAVHEDPESLIICNGYKDRGFIRTALMGQRLNKKVILVVEKPEELELALEEADKLKVEPMIGLRIRTQTRGTGRWAISGGDDAKFGLSTAEILEAVNKLKAKGQLSCLKLLHFHIGSQISDILTINRAVREATRYYAKLTQLGCEIDFLDVGGGLGVDYDGTRTTTDSSINYTLQEYTREIIHNVADVCGEEGVPHPHIVNEGGRALVAHHSVLIVEAFGSISKARTPIREPGAEDHKLLQDLHEIRKKMTKRNRRETLHRVLQVREEAMNRFELGILDLETKASIEETFWHMARHIVDSYSSTKKMPPEVEELAGQLGEQFICNFSVFQSLIDHWAVDQLFPIMPIHRLDEEPTKQSTLVDITCDSDGKIARFIQGNDISPTLPLHPLTGDPYYLGLFLTGAYQDVMGDLHNLFGPVNEAHVFLDEDEDEGFYIEETIPGITIKEVLEDVQYEPSYLVRKLKTQIDQAIKSDQLKPQEGMKLLNTYKKTLGDPTYLGLESQE